MYSDVEKEKIRENVKEEFEKNQFKKWKSKASEYVDDKDKATKLLDEAVKKADDKKKGPMGEVWENLQLFFSLIRDWINGSYKDIPVTTIVMIFAGLLYFVTPIDIIPDFIPIIGYLDDATVLAFIIKQMGADFENYKTWKSERI